VAASVKEIRFTEGDFDNYLHRGSDDSNSKYLVDYQASDNFYVIVTEGQTEILISEVEYSQAESESQAHSVQSFGDYSDRDVRGNISEQASILVDYLNQKGIESIGVGPEFPSLLTKSLEDAGFEVSVLEENPVERARMIKTEDELEKMRSIQKKTENAMQEAENILENSRIEEDDKLYWQGDELTSERLREAIRNTIPDADFPIQTIAASGKTTGNPHKVGEGAIKAHTPIVIDIFPKGQHGYFGDMTRTFVKGDVPEQIQEMHSACLEALEDALDEVKAGLAAEKVHRTALETVKSHGFDDEEEHNGYLQTTGHSLGLDVHEPPRLTKGSIELKENMVITIEPGLYYPDKGGVRTEDMVRVTEEGCENFNDMDSYLTNVD
jgi:Xaa-Pro aminopeptidase